ncbi:MAG: tRNA (adenosine(37)-N6)-threonylcarbamoyltransferase complex ATPase subunit type 1 TsaE [bacterium]|nr:tRNA (adenosine(37)-N6)-threonylcarbamoyltransferase complex ATPase subunit type 1 TsaE [bacterium]
MKISSCSSSETKKFAGLLAKKVLKKPSKNSALVIGLSGDLGAGKTTFVQGFLKAIGVKKRITSPTFVLIKNYQITKLPNRHIYHIDCYRFQKPKELLKLEFKEIINNPQNIILIEWAEKIKKILPKKNVIWLKFDYGKKENERNIKTMVI